MRWCNVQTNGFTLAWQWPMDITLAWQWPRDWGAFFSTIYVLGGHLLSCLEWDLDNSYPRQLVPRTTRTQDNSYPRQLVPRTTRNPDNSYPGQFLHMWYDMISYMIRYHTIRYHISYRIVSYHIIYHISYHIISYIISYHIISYHIYSFHPILYDDKNSITTYDISWDNISIPN